MSSFSLRHVHSVTSSMHVYRRVQYRFPFVVNIAQLSTLTRMISIGERRVLHPLNLKVPVDSGLYMLNDKVNSYPCNYSYSFHWTSMMQHITTIQYSASKLYQLRSKYTRSAVSQDIFNRLKDLGILRTRRGSRGGQHRRCSHQYPPLQEIIPWDSSVPLSDTVAESPFPVLIRGRIHHDLDVFATRTNESLIDIQLQHRAPKYLPTLILFNARSLNKIFNQFHAIQQTNFKDTHLIAVTETWFSDANPASECQLPLYHLFHKDRRGQKGGGVMHSTCEMI